MKYLFLFLILVLLFACRPEKQDMDSGAVVDSLPKPELQFHHDGELKIFDAKDKEITTFKIEIAQTVDSRMRGLMQRESMEDDQGMLFIHEYPDFHSFWMKDTYLPLDMIFIDENKRIFYIHENAEPFSEDLIFPDAKALYTLELKAGISKRWNLKPGDRIRWTRNYN